MGKQMQPPSPGFEIATADTLDITDTEIAELLKRVYVDGGYTTPAAAKSLFDPEAVRSRGLLVGARDRRDAKFAGMIILVPPESPARRYAGPGEAEVHLIGVLPEYRQQGLGRLLMEDAIDRAIRLGYTKLILWTQLSMTAAQKLYESTGFRPIKDYERDGHKFRLYERSLQSGA